MRKEYKKRDINQQRDGIRKVRALGNLQGGQKVNSGRRIE